MTRQEDAETEWLDRQLAAEGVLRARYALARRMLRRLLIAGWRIETRPDGSLWWWRWHVSSLSYDRIPLDPDERALWESIRTDPMDAQ